MTGRCEIILNNGNFVYVKDGDISLTEFFAQKLSLIHISTKRAANCRAENSPDRNENNRDFFRSSFLLPAKAKIFVNVPRCV